jgi:hypothetical protein
VTSSTGTATVNHWTNPNNVKLDDGSYSTWSGAKFDGNDPGTGPELRTTNYGFNIPYGSTITGIELKIEGYTDANVVGEVAYLSISGSPPLYGTQKIDDWAVPVGSASPLGPGTHVYGSSTDTWGAVLTPAVVNNANFGWNFMIYDSLAPLNMAVDYMQMRIHYNTASPIIIIMGI